MTEKDIFNAIREVINRQFLVSSELIKPDTDLQETFSLESLDCVEMLMLLENKLNCRLTDDEENLLRESFRANPTPQTMVDCFCKKLEIIQPNKNPLYTKSVPELIAIIERQGAELAKLRAKKR